MPIHRLPGGHPAAAFQDPLSVAPDLAGQPRSWWYVGGFKNLVSGATVAARLAPPLRSRVRRSLIVEAYRAVECRGGTPIALYARDEELPDFRAALGPRFRAVQTTSNAILDIGWPDLDGYLASLDKKRRYRVRRDWHELHTRGIRAIEIPAAEVDNAAAHLIAATQVRHGVPDHPRLAALRLREWWSGDGAQCRAFVLRGSSGELVGVSFAERHGRVVELSELGLVENIPDRHLAYTELLVYAPLRYALRHGCGRLSLGLDSIAPKSHRGARVEPVWAVTVAG
jgi:predicted N-acyltransferase